MAKKKLFTEKVLLVDLDVQGAHADELAQLIDVELECEPLRVLAGSVKYYDRPTDPVGEDDWEANS